MTNLLIIGATGSIGQTARNYLLQHTNDRLTLMARHTQRLNTLDPTRERVIQGSVTDASPCNKRWSAKTSFSRR